MNHESFYQDRPSRLGRASRLLAVFGFCLFSSAMEAGQEPVTPVSPVAMPALEEQVNALLARMSLAEKIGQMTQGEILDIKQAMQAGQHPIRDLNLGSVLAGGNSIVAPNTPESWRRELAVFQAEARASRAALPLLIGVDAVHGHGLVQGATVFPHNIGLGAARNPELMKKIGAATAKEVLLTGFNWDFAPGVIVARDIRWGRSYESFGETAELQRLLVKPYVEGLQDVQDNGRYMVASAKHFIGDGGTTWGTGMADEKSKKPEIDRGDTRMDLNSLLALHGAGYEEAIAAGVDTVMASYNSVNGLKMHAHRNLLSDYLKKSKAQSGLGFDGFVISDWNAVDELNVPETPDPIQRYQKQLVLAVDAGVDMIMVQGKLPLAGGKEDHDYRFVRVTQLLAQAVELGQLSEGRVNDAVRRILRVKIKSGLLQPDASSSSDKSFGSAAHRQIAREAARESLVLLKNSHKVLPISKRKYSQLCVAGSKADDYGVQVGAWTLGWQGQVGKASKPEGAMTILDGLKDLAEKQSLPLEFAASGAFLSKACRLGKGALTVAVVGENPYAEFSGDSDDLHLSADDLAVLKKAKAKKGLMAVVLVSGRPLIVTEQLPGWDALIAAWLPGSQGEAVGDLLFGTTNFKGRLPQTWPRSMAQLPFGNREEGLFRYGFGLIYPTPASAVQKKSGVSRGI